MEYIGEAVIKVNCTHNNSNSSSPLAPTKNKNGARGEPVNEAIVIELT